MAHHHTILSAGETFGYWTVIEPSQNIYTGVSTIFTYLCRCVCGTVSSIRYGELKRGTSKSCGCHRGRPQPPTGSVFGVLTVLSTGEYKKNSRGNSRTTNCICRCGTSLTVLTSNLLSGRTKSCGCGKHILKHRDNSERVALNRISGTYKGRAERRGISWILTISEFEDLVHGDCFYCGSEPCRTRQVSTRSRITYNGIDRIDSSGDYIRGNVVSCCTTCNTAKSDHSQADFIQWILKAAKNLMKD